MADLCPVAEGFMSHMDVQVNGHGLCPICVLETVGEVLSWLMSLGYSALSYVHIPNDYCR